MRAMRAGVYGIKPGSCPMALSSNSTMLDSTLTNSLEILHRLRCTCKNFSKILCSGVELVFLIK